MSQRSSRGPGAKIVPATPKTTPAPRWLRIGTLALAAVAMLAWFSPASGDNDAWWHLKTGQYIVEHHRLPVPDPFSYTTYMGKPAYPGEEITRYFNLTHEWLAQAILYLVYSAAGFPGLVLFRALLLAGVCAIAGFLALLRSGGFYRAIGASIIAGSVAISYTSDRPGLFTWLLLAVTLLILEQRRRLWLLPPLFLVWANCHGGYFLGWAAMGAYCAEAWLSRRRGRGTGGERRLWLACAASVAICGLNPNGFSAIPVLLNYHRSAIQSRIWEWKSPTFWPPQPFNVVLAATVAMMIWARRRVRPADWLLFGLFTLATVTAARNLMLTGVLGPVLLAGYLPWKRGTANAARYAAPLVLSSLAAVPMVRGEAFQLRAIESNRPAGAADFLLAHHVTARMFNSYNNGGYLIWRLAPHQQVFIDSRALNESVYQDFRHIANYEPQAAELLDRYGIEAIVMEGFEDITGIIWPLPLALAASPRDDWKLAYSDSTAFIFMRHPPEGVAPLPNTSVVPGIEAQCRYHLEQNPSDPLCATALMDLFLRQGDRQRAEYWSATALAHR